MLTFVVVVFILLTQYMLKYFDDFVGKDLGLEVFTELIMYFSINMTPVAVPLAVLLSSLMTFGTLGEHFELTAIKGAGVSLTRALQPLFFFVVLISALAFLSNNYVVPKANLKAYSLLYDIKQKKPALDIREGVFYGGIPQYEIKVNEKYPDGKTLREIIIYDHTKGLGNKDVIIADSGKMYTVHNDRYLMLELFNGNRYSENSLPGTAGSGMNRQFTRNSFDETKLMFSLASFDMQRTKEEYFASHRRMKTMEELGTAVDSLGNEKLAIEYEAFNSSGSFYEYHLRYDSLMPQPLKQWISRLEEQEEEFTDSLTLTPEDDSIRMISGQEPDLRSLPATARVLAIRERNTDRRELQSGSGSVGKELLKIEDVDTSLVKTIDASITDNEYVSVINRALNQSKLLNNTLQINASKLEKLNSDINKHEYESLKKIAQAVSCLIMFLIGAPLGAIIKRGGLGVPVLISICFFIAFYVLTEISRKWADDLLMNAEMAVWFPNLVLLPFGIVFLLQARQDTRLLEMDFYNVWIERAKEKLTLLKRKMPV